MLDIYEHMKYVVLYTYYIIIYTFIYIYRMIIHETFFTKIDCTIVSVLKVIICYYYSSKVIFAFPEQQLTKQ